MTVKKPNLFVIGAPKCGTTALCNYLSSHPDVFFSDPKELHFFSKDFPEEGKHNNFRNEEEYLEYFRAASQYPIVGEGSTRYLLSKEAVPRILEFQPNALFVVMLRNPIDLFLSLHAHLYYLGEEDLKDPQMAWEAQWVRKLGERIPLNCGDRESLLYKEVCSLGEQMERLLNKVPSSRVHIILLEDLKREPAITYRSLLAFLGLSDDGRHVFPIMNTRKPRSRFLQLIARRPPGSLLKVAEIGKQILGIRRWGVMSKIQHIATGSGFANTKEIPSSFREQLQDHFSKDVEKLSEWTGRDLSHWIEKK